MQTGNKKKQCYVRSTAKENRDNFENFDADQHLSLIRLRSAIKAFDQNNRNVPQKFSRASQISMNRPE